MATRRGTPSAPGSPNAPRRSSRKLRLLLGALVLAAVAGVVIGLFTFFRPAPAPLYLGIAVTEYDDHNFPVNAFAQQDGAMLRKHFKTDSAQAFQSQKREPIMRELNQLADSSASPAMAGRPIVVYFSANALVQEGSVFIIPADGQAGIPATWIRFEDLLNSFKKIKGDRLVLLDLKPVVDARLGVFVDELPDRIHDMLTRLAQANELPFTICVSCGPRSTPLVCRELPRSDEKFGAGVFGWFVDRGLAGEADGSLPGASKDKWVSAGELAAYARDGVSSFSGGLGQAQQPAIYGTGKDFNLLPVPPGGPKLAGKPEAAEAYPEWLLDYWRKDRDAWWEQGLDRRLQRTYRHLEAILLRGQSLWLGGAEPDKTRQEVDTVVGHLRANKQSFVSWELPVHSLAWARRPATYKPRAADKEAQVALEPIIKQIQFSAAGKKEDAVELQKKLMPLLAREKPLDAQAVAAVIFDAARDSKLTADQLKQLVEALQTLTGAPKLVETLVLEFVTKVGPERLGYWKSDPDTIPGILRATEAAEKAIPADGRALPWLQSELEQTDKRKRNAILQLLTGERNDRAKARQELDECAASYAKIAKSAACLDNAFKEFDTTRVFLADWIGFEAPDPTMRQELDDLWISLAHTCKEIQPLLKPPVSGRAPAAAQLTSLADDLGQLRERVLQRVRSGVDQNRAASAAELERWLAWPFWKADDRGRLADRMNTASLKLVQDALQAGKPAPLAPAPAGAGWRDAATVRARQVQDLLDLAGEIPTTGVDIDAEMMPAGNQSPADRARALARRWNDTLPKVYKTAELSVQAQIGWLIHPFDLPAYRATGDRFPPDASAELIQTQLKELGRWVAERDRLDAAMLSKVAGMESAREMAPAANNLAEALRKLAGKQSNWPEVE